jgi:hypothetical protein
MNNDNTDAAEEVNDWRNEHGEPDFAYLQSLKDDGSPRALERLRSIASDLDVHLDSATPDDEIIGRIRLATQRNEDGNVNVTN